MKPGLLASGMSLLFWGALVVVIDFRVNRFDVLPDLLGWVAMLVGLSRLRHSHRDGGGNDAISFCQVVVVISAVLSLLPASRTSYFVEWAITVAQLVATVSFTGVMAVRLRAVGWKPLVARWLSVRKWILWLWCVPFAVASLLWLGAESRIYSSDIVIPAVILFFVPLLLMLAAMWSTRTCALSNRVSALGSPR